MALAMTRPTPHPKTGVYRVRVAIPAPLRQTALRLYGRRREFIEGLRTKDRAEAKRLAPAAVARLQGMIEATRRAAAGEASRVPDRDVLALAGEHYRGVLDTFGDDPTNPANNGRSGRLLEQTIAYALAQTVVADEGGASHLAIELDAGQLDDARAALRNAGLPCDPETVERVAAAQWRAGADAMAELRKRAGGDWSPSPTAARFPTRQAASKAGQGAACSFDALLRGWGLDRGWSIDAKPINRNLYDRLRTMERLAAFLGHRDAGRVTKADAVRWKTEAQQRGLSAATVRNDISEMSAVWRWGLSHDIALPHGNPFAGILPPKPKRQATIRPFTDAEAAAILRAARGRTGLLRWLLWVCCLTGARLNEIVQSVKEDVTKIDGVTVLRIHDDGAGRSLKNADSRRTVPIHPGLIAEGFLDYVGRLRSGSPLFPDVKPDAKFGSRANPAGKRVSYWMRKTLRITDTALSPDHSWRHWFTDAARRAGIQQEIRSALTGHSARADESAAYGAGMGSFTRLLADAIGRVALPAGLDAAPSGHEAREDSPTTDPIGA